MMRDYIINLPQLQTPGKRIASLALWLLCWLMWIYLMFPLATLAGWLLGDHNLTDEMRWFGGYKSLLELLQIYMISLASLAGLWLIWVFFHYVMPPNLIEAAQKNLSDEELADYFQVPLPQLQSAKSSTYVTVYFDDKAGITQLQIAP